MSASGRFSEVVVYTGLTVNLGNYFRQGFLMGVAYLGGDVRGNADTKRLGSPVSYEDPSNTLLLT